ncbi:primosomal protein N' [Pseudoclavibacter chungangensis]|uniref:Probable replication restart protein PriA n=1 Tax=Pseudoclavibacter chungangensis TaxID=587635 RepID=A0A7J5BU55_9MICO|nr:primosomal protein N' [Pseudoclavibacter chungangensis]KAB1657841.1 primosomal protein N' [Pseudoclavibacter chungangensis]NYJ66559.1 primosomal protein N' (replication factor Y) [Pseudoclavibacter chungangensis]
MPADAPDVARVVVATPLPQLDRLLEYRVPAALVGRVGPGMRVRVPLRSGKRVLPAYVVEVVDEAEYAGDLAEIEELVSEAPVLTPEIAALAREVADRQAGTAADVLRLAIPERSVRVEQRWLEVRGEPVARDAETVIDIPEPPATYTPDDWAELTGGDDRRIALRVPTGVDTVHPPGRREPVGVPRALGLIADLATTYVAAGRDVIVAVPDFRDVELLGAALEVRLPADRIRRLDTRAKPAVRYRDFLACLGDEAGVVIGTRSVVYAPASRLACVIVWDDGDDSFEEPLAPYAHTREVALARQRREGTTLVLAAHAPSVETERLVEIGWLRPVAPTRFRPPKIVPSNAVIGDEAGARGARIPSAAWRLAREALDSGPVLVQVARAGYVPGLACDSCRTLARCRACGGPLRLARAGAAPTCAVCGTTNAGWRCPECGGERLRSIAVGAGRTAEELGRAFPGVRVVVADGETGLVSIGAAPALVVSTRGAEPVPAQGYRAVLLLDGERLLAREALDVGLEALRYWSSAAALLADRGSAVLVGAEEGPGRALVDWRQPAYAAAELADRRALEFPPAVRVGTVSGTAAEVDRALDAVRDLDGVRILGPVPDDDGSVRATIRFGYAAGAEVARRLKVEIVKAATSGRPAVAGRPRGRGSTLRVRLDPPHLF